MSAEYGGGGETGDTWVCRRCNKVYEFDENGEGGWVCSECGEEGICDDCAVQFKNAEVTVCKRCVDRLYPRSAEKIYVSGDTTQKPGDSITDKPDDEFEKMLEEFEI